MEKITTYNYEAFYLDYLEGNLNEDGVTLLFDFLNNNPALKAELELDDDVLDFTLNPIADSLSTFEKEDLKQFDCKHDEICLNNVDDFIIADFENEISTIKKEELDTFIGVHNLEQRKNAFFATQLKPNLAEVYPNHGELKKKGIIIPLVVKIASVAAVGLLLFNLFGAENVNTEIYNPRQESFALNIDSSQQKFNVNVVPTSIDSNIANSAHNEKDTPNLNNDGHVNEQLNKLPNSNNGSDFAQVEKQNKEIKKKGIDSAENEIVNKDENPTPIDIIDNNVNDNDFASANTENSSSNIKLIDMYKPVTQLANSYTNLDVSYKKSTADSDLKITSFKIGKFSFERKTNK